MWLSSTDVPKIKGVHEYAMLYPFMTPDESATLTADIGRYGQRDPIVVMPDGRILDGRHRYDSCRNLGIEPFVVKFVGSDGTASEEEALAYVRAKNGARRHLTPSQRAMVAARIRKFANETQQARAQAHGVSKRLVEHADKVLDSDDQGLIAEVDAGLAVSTASNRLDAAAKQPAEEKHAAIRARVEATSTANSKGKAPKHRPGPQRASGVLSSEELDEPSPGEEATAVEWFESRIQDAPITPVSDRSLTVLLPDSTAGNLDMPDLNISLKSLRAVEEAEDAQEPQDAESALKPVKVAWAQFVAQIEAPMPVRQETTGMPHRDQVRALLAVLANLDLLGTEWDMVFRKVAAKRSLDELERYLRERKRTGR